jgi:hypothetical protein
MPITSLLGWPPTDCRRISVSEVCCSRGFGRKISCLVGLAQAGTSSRGTFRPEAGHRRRCYRQGGCTTRENGASTVSGVLGRRPTALSWSRADTGLPAIGSPPARRRGARFASWRSPAEGVPRKVRISYNGQAARAAWRTMMKAVRRIQFARLARCRPLLVASPLCEDDRLKVDTREGRASAPMQVIHERRGARWRSGSSHSAQAHTALGAQRHPRYVGLPAHSMRGHTSSIFPQACVSSVLRMGHSISSPDRE